MAYEFSVIESHMVLKLHFVFNEVKLRFSLPVIYEFKIRDVMSAYNKVYFKKKNVPLEEVIWSLEKVGVNWSQYKKNLTFRVKESSQGTGVIIAVNSINNPIGLFKDRKIKEWILAYLNSGEQVWGCITYRPKNKPTTQTKFNEPVLVSLSTGSIPKVKHKPKSAPPIRPPLSTSVDDKSLEPPKVSPQLKNDTHPIIGICFKSNLNLKSLKKKFDGKVGIYCIYSRCFFTYIGQSTNIYDRFERHVSDLKRGVHHNKAMQSDWNRAGEKTFSFHMIKECEIEELNQLEKEYIENYKTYEYGYNSTPDGQGNKKCEQTFQGITPKTQEVDKLMASSEDKLIEINATLEEYISKFFYDVSCSNMEPAAKNCDTDLSRDDFYKPIKPVGSDNASLIINDKIRKNSSNYSFDENEKSRPKNILNQPDIMFQPTKFTTSYHNVEIVPQGGKNKNKRTDVN